MWFEQDSPFVGLTYLLMSLLFFMAGLPSSSDVDGSVSSMSDSLRDDFGGGFIYYLSTDMLDNMGEIAAYGADSIVPSFVFSFFGLVFLLLFAVSELSRNTGFHA